MCADGGSNISTVLRGLASNPTCALHTTCSESDIQHMFQNFKDSTDKGPPDVVKPPFLRTSRVWHRRLFSQQALHIFIFIAMMIHAMVMTLIHYCHHLCSTCTRCSTPNMADPTSPLETKRGFASRHSEMSKQRGWKGCERGTARYFLHSFPSCLPSHQGILAPNMPVPAPK